jgi:hypothetical protein
MEEALALAPVHARVFEKLPVVLCKRDLFVAVAAQQVFRVSRQFLLAPAAELFHHRHRLFFFAVILYARALHKTLLVVISAALFIQAKAVAEAFFHQAESILE